MIINCLHKDTKKKQHRFLAIKSVSLAGLFYFAFNRIRFKFGYSVCLYKLADG
jgi:hypothetical protein